MSATTQTTDEQRKAKADADAAEVAARKAEREEREASTPAAVARRELLAGKDAAAAQREQVSALVPDFGKVTRGGLTVTPGGQPTAGTGVAGEAFRDAAAWVTKEVIHNIGADDWSVLVTSDPDLVASDATYQDVKSGLGLMTRLARDVLASTEHEGEHVERFVGAASLAVGAVASALPGILSLLSAPRTVTTGTVEFDDIAAGAAVAGALKGRNPKRKVVHDSVRLAPGGGLLTAVERLQRRRHALVERQTALEARHPTSDGASASSGLAAAIALVTKTIESIDTYLGALHAPPAGGGRSPLTDALLREGLHDGTFQYVLLVKAQSASGMQMVKDNLIRGDEFAVLAAASITWILLSLPSGEVLDAAVTTGTAQATGKIAESFSLQVKR